MNYEYTDVTNVQIKMSLTPWEANQLIGFLKNSSDFESYTCKTIILILNESIEKAGSSLALEGEHVKEYVKRNLETVENNDA